MPNKELYDFLLKVPSLKGAKPLKDFNTFTSNYITPAGHKILYDFLKTVPELKGAAPLSSLESFNSTYFAVPDLDKKEKDESLKSLQTAASEKPAFSMEISNPLLKNQVENEKKVQPFKDFRKLVPDPKGVSDSTYVGQDMYDFYVPNTVSIKVGNNKPVTTYSLDLTPSLTVNKLNEKVRQFKLQTEKEIQRLKDEKEAKIRPLYYQEAVDKEKRFRDPEVPFARNLEYDRNGRIKQIEDITKEYDRRINEVSNAYQQLKQNTFDGLYQSVKNKKEIENRSISAENLPELRESLKRTKAYIDSLNNQPAAQRIKQAGEYAVGKETIGESDEQIAKKLEQYQLSDVTNPNFMPSSSLGKQTKEYQGTVESLQLNNSLTDSYIKQKKDFQKNLEKQKAEFEKILNEKIFSKGLTLDDLTPESKQNVEKQRAKFAEQESFLPMYDELIASSKKRSDVLLSDIGSFKDLVNYKAEQDKINKLYEESPISTIVANLPSEFLKRMYYGGAEALSFGNVYVQKKLGNISKEDADLYLNKIKELSERPVYIQKLVVDENTGQLVYKNLKEVESVSIFGKAGELNPSIKNVDALLYNIFNTTAESFLTGGTASIFRKGAFYLGEKILGKQLSNLAIAEAISASTVGLSGASKAGYLAAKGAQKAATWGINVTSMIPATTLLYSPEIINREIEKGLSVEDVAMTAGLRLLAENVAENLFFDDVKFIDDLLKTGQIRNFTELSKSEAYRLLMDKVSIASIGRRMSEMEFKALFTAKGLRNLLSKENYQYLIKKTIPEKARWLRDASLFALDTQVKESGEEVSTNWFNVMIDQWKQSEDSKYESDQPFTFENQVNTVVQTMASMLLMGGMQGVKMASKGASDRRYNIDLAAYNVAISPQVFKENLYDQFLKSQNTKNPMSEDELALRMNEIDRIATVYNSLGFTEEKTKENIKNQIEKIKSELDAKSKKEQEEDTGNQEEDVLNSFFDNKNDDALDKEILRQAQIEVRNTEFQAFRDALTKSKLENDFINAKTDEQKEKILEKLNETIENIETLKEQRREQQQALQNKRTEIRQKQYDDVVKNLSKIVDNIDEYVDQFDDLNTIEEEISVLESYKETTDEKIKNYSSIILVGLKNKQAQLISEGAKRLTDEELEEQRVFKLNNFDETEKEILTSLKIPDTDISKTDGVITYNYEDEEVKFKNFEELLDFIDKKRIEKIEEIKRKKRIEEENEKISYLQRNVVDVDAQEKNIEPGRLYRSSSGKFGIQYPSGESVEFDSVDELEEYLFEEVPEEVLETEEDLKQKDLDDYNKELDELFNEYNKKLKRKTTKEKFLALKNKKVREQINALKQKYNIPGARIEEERLGITFSPLITELTEEEITSENLQSNKDNLGVNYLGYKLVDASSAIAYQARKYVEERETLEGTPAIVKESINDNADELNKETLFLHSAKFLPGQKFTVVVKELEDSQYIAEQKKKLRENMQYLINQGISEFEILKDLDDDNMFREIQIFTEDGKYVGAVHSISYIRPSRIADIILDSSSNPINNLAENYKKLKSLRGKIINADKKGKVVSLTFADKNIGYLSLTKDLKNRKLREAFKNKEALDKITVLRKQSKLRVGTQETMNEGMQGGTVLPIITPKGTYFALNLSKRKLEDVQINSFLSAIKLHIQYNDLATKELTSEEDIQAFEKINQIVEQIIKETNNDITTVDGLKNYLNLFVNVNSKTKDYRNDENLANVPFMDIDADRDGKLRITFSNFRTFPEEAMQITEFEYEQIGIYRLKNLTLASFENEIIYIREHLQKRTVNHSVDLAEKNKQFNLPYLEETGSKKNPYTFVSETKLNESGLKNKYKNYREFLIDTSLTPVIETEFEGNYIYFQQPRLNFTVDISEQSAPESTEEEKEKPKKRKRTRKAPAKPGTQKTLFEQEAKPEETTAIDKLKDVESTAKQKSDPDLANIDPVIIAARNGDKQAQKKLEEYGLDWEQTTTYRFVGQPEVDVLLSDKKVESKRFSDAGIDVTTSPKVTSAANAEYRVTFKESFDVNNGLGKVKLKSKEEGDHNLEKGRGYTLNDVAKIERLDENGNVVEVIYDSESLLSKEEAPVTTDAKADIERRRQEELEKSLALVQIGIKAPGFFTSSYVEKEVGNSDKVIAIKSILKSLEKLNKQNKLTELQKSKFEELKEINAKYDAELAALEGKKEEKEETTEEVPNADDAIMKETEETAVEKVVVEENTSTEAGMNIFESFGSSIYVFESQFPNEEERGTLLKNYSAKHEISEEEAESEIREAYEQETSNIEGYTAYLRNCYLNK